MQKRKYILYYKKEPFAIIEWVNKKAKHFRWVQLFKEHDAYKPGEHDVIYDGDDEVRGLTKLWKVFYEID